MELYRQAGGTQHTSLNMHGFVADTREAAADTYYPAHSGVMNRIGRERGWGPTSRAAFDAATGMDGAYLVGDPEAVAEKILHLHELFGHDRMLIQMAIGDVAHRDVLRAIELLGTEVAPRVRAGTTRPVGVG
jgi:alkanesulfonate monooxygenase SsuD/methylene tetrahydromethanopterin reductase-like flavin-dependent oxidoreductase (luciferase family)